MTLTEQKAAAKAFAQAWKGRGDEKQETQKFWIELLHNVYGIASPTTVLEFEKKVKLEGSTKFIDVYIPDTKVIVEQKSIDIDLSKEVSQSGGECLTPYNQARRYDNNLPVAQKAKIEATAQGILDARALYPDCSLADLYDELTMPIELRKAHQANDRAVMDAYGFDKSMSESDIVAALFKMYQALTEK